MTNQWFTSDHGIVKRTRATSRLFRAHQTWAIGIVLLFFPLVVVPLAKGQVYESNLRPIVTTPIETPEVWGYEQRQYYRERTPTVAVPGTAAQWTEQAQTLRTHLLDVIYHGWPKEWINSGPVFHEVGRPLPGNGYRIRKLRYEVVPGLWSTMLLYEPEHADGNAPAVMSLVGHFYGKGKAMEYNQALCINYALRGIIAAAPEWLDTGELNSPENNHIDFEAHLDLVGANPVGLFYLKMRRVVDYLYEQPNVDKNRIGVTGLSGGGWQALVLSALDSRVYASVPVSGFQSIGAGLDKVARPGSFAGTGDMEETPTDFYTVLDYPALVAMRAPRPTLLVHNDTDDCCFRAPLVKPDNYESAVPFYKLFGKQDLLQWHVNIDPGTHNYELDNRQQSYRFFAQQFGISARDDEIPVQNELRTYEELEVGVPKDNLTFLGLAKKIAAETQHPPVPQNPAQLPSWSAEARARLKGVVRYKPLTVKYASGITNTRGDGLESLAYRFQLSNNLSATAIWAKETSTPDDAPLVVFLDDNGKQQAIGETVHGVPVLSQILEAGNQLLLLDPIFTPQPGGPPLEARYQYPELSAAFGDRPLGIEAAQVLSIARWTKNARHARGLRLVSYGIRSQIISLVAAALEPDAFSGLDIHGAMGSFGHLLDGPVTYSEAPDLFCQDLYKEFDVPQLQALAGAGRIRQELMKQHPTSSSAK
jgi:dienelactone hydrolase